MNRREAIASALSLPMIKQVVEANPSKDVLILTIRDDTAEVAIEEIKEALRSAGFPPERCVMLVGCEAAVVRGEKR